MKILNSKTKNFDKNLDYLLFKRRKSIKSDKVSVTNIINDVKKNGDKALIKYEKKFNQNSTIIPSALKISKLIKSLNPKVKKAIDTAYNRIYKFHSLQKFKNISYTDKFKNKLEYKYLPLESVAIYVPGSLVSYPSSVLMNAIPAIVAGVKRIVMINPGFKGNQNPAVLYAARKCKIKEIYSIGGPSAIAAVSYGTKKIKKVDKIVGPGNAYVAAAKKEVFGDVGIDMVAGPSEVSIVADKFADANLVAADLIAQAEHDVNAQSILITDNKNVIQLVNLSLKKQLNKLPKKNIASKSLKNFGLAIYTKKRQNIIDAINTIAPEHLELLTNINKEIIKGVKNAGSIFIGKFSPEAIGDYLAGPNHVLPTSGSARFSSGLSVNDFLKRHSLIKITKTGIERLGSSVINLAKHENLDGHANSVKLRLKKEK